MVIRFRTRGLETVANDGRAAQKALGKRCAALLRTRLDDLRAADNLDVMRHLPGRCHELKGDRAGQFAMDLEHPRHFVFKPLDGESRADGGIDWATIKAIEIIEITNYHRQRASYA